MNKRLIQTKKTQRGGRMRFRIQDDDEDFDDEDFDEEDWEEDYGDEDWEE